MNSLARLASVSASSGRTTAAGRSRCAIQHMRARGYHIPKPTAAGEIVELQTKTGRLHGTIGSGGRRLALETVNGSIRLRKST